MYVRNGRQEGENECGVKHGQKFVDCQMRVVYKTPLERGKVYINVDGASTSALENTDTQASKQPMGNLSFYCKTCRTRKFTPYALQDILAHAKDRITRESIEDYHVICEAGGCDSTPSILL